MGTISFIGLDKEISEWIAKNPKAAQSDFESICVVFMIDPRFERGFQTDYEVLRAQERDSDNSDSCVDWLQRTIRQLAKHPDAPRCGEFVGLLPLLHQFA